MAGLVEQRKTSGPTIDAGGARVTPEASALIVRLPFGAFVWHRPTSVLIERAGQVERLSIIDVTRLVQVGLWCSVIAFWFIRARKERSRD
jgi:hypothetical protein